MVVTWGSVMSTTLSEARCLVEVRLAFYARRIPALRRRMIELLAADLRDLHDVLERTNLDGHYWVWAGLLLGWAREGAILPHDNDADFGVTDADFHRLVSAVPEITKAGFRCDRRFVNNDGIVTQLVFIRHGARFDFFRMFPEAGRLRFFAYSAGKDGAVQLEQSVPEQATVPFTFLDRTWLKHEDHYLELRTMYGAWQIPDPSWSYLEGAAIDARHPWRVPEYKWRGGAAALTSDIPRQVPGG
jgi:hypothetical protein